MLDLKFERRGAGEPMLLLHGIGSELCVWEPVLDSLAREFEVIAVDLPGFGHSPALPEDIAPTPRALARAVGDLLDELGVVSAHAVGNSLGGWIALELATLGRTRSVTAICPAGLWGAPVLGAGAAVRGRAHRLVRRLRPVIPIVMASRRVRRLALGAFVADPAKVPYRAAVRMVLSYGRATAYDATASAMRQGFFADAGSLKVPVTLAFGEHDRLIRPTRIANQLAHSILLPGCGHVPMWDAPELIVQVIEATTRSAGGRVRTDGLGAMPPTPEHSPFLRLGAAGRG